MKRAGACLAVWAAVALASASCLVAQAGAAPGTAPLPDDGVPSTRVRLSLKEAVQLALRENPQAMIARLRVRESRDERAVALSALLPQARLVGREAIVRFNQQSIIGGALPKRVGPFQAVSAGADFFQEMLDLSSVRKYEASRAGARAAALEEQSVREQIASLVVAQYLSILNAMATAEAAQARVALAERLYNQAEHLARTGVGTEIDSLRAQVELQNEKQRAIDAETARNAAMYALAQTLDLPGEAEPEVTDAMRFFELPALDRAALLSAALRNRPEMKALAAQRRAAKLQQAAASEERWPSIGFSGAYGYQARKPDDGIPAYTYAVTVSVPVWTSGRLRAERDRARQEEQRIAEQQRELASEIRRQVDTALDHLEAARHSVEVANLGRKLAEEEVGRAERRFQAGVATNIEVVTAQDELARADDNQIEALYRFNQSRADLARASGKVETTYGQ